MQVIAIAPDGFALRSRGGHPEGAGRTITFEFQTYVNEAEISTMSLEVEAWGPLGGTSLLGPLNSNTIAKTSWRIFSDNITNRYPDLPPGGFVPPGGGRRGLAGRGLDARIDLFSSSLVDPELLPRSGAHPTRYRK